MNARVMIEIEWTPSPEDLEKVYDGDAPVDFAWRSFERHVRPWLTGAVMLGGVVRHYHILTAPKIMPED